MGESKIVSSGEKFDLLARISDEMPEDDYRDWEGETLMEVLGSVSGKKVLEVGCGSGRLLSRLEHSGADTMGIDISREMVERAKRKSLLVFQSDVSDFVWNEMFDVIVSVRTFNYIEDKRKALESVWYMLRLGGLFVLVSDLSQEDVAIHVGNEMVAARYYPLSKDGYWSLLVEMGFDIKDSVDLFPSETTRGILQPYEIIGFILKAQKTHEVPEEDLRS